MAKNNCLVFAKTNSKWKNQDKLAKNQLGAKTGDKSCSSQLLQLNDIYNKRIHEI